MLCYNDFHFATVLVILTTAMAVIRRFWWIFCDKQYFKEHSTSISFYQQSPILKGWKQPLVDSEHKNNKKDTYKNVYNMPLFLG